MQICYRPPSPHRNVRWDICKGKTPRVQQPFASHHAMPRMEVTRNHVSHRDVKTGAPRPRGQYTIGLCVRGNAGLSPPAAESGQARQGMAGQFPRHPSSVVGMVPAGRRAKVRTPKWWRGGHRSVVGETAVWRPGKGRRRPGIFSRGSFERCGGGVVHHQKFIKKLPFTYLAVASPKTHSNHSEIFTSSISTQG